MAREAAVEEKDAAEKAVERDAEERAVANSEVEKTEVIELRELTDLRVKEALTEAVAKAEVATEVEIDPKEVRDNHTEAEVAIDLKEREDPTEEEAATEAEVEKAPREKRAAIEVAVEEVAEVATETERTKTRPILMKCRFMTDSSTMVSTLTSTTPGIKALPDQSTLPRGRVALAEAEKSPRVATERATGEMLKKKPEPTLTFLLMLSSRLLFQEKRLKVLKVLKLLLIT